MKRIIISMTVIIIGAAALLFAADRYLEVPVPDKFLANTKINGIDVSGMTPGEADAELERAMSSKNFSFGYKGKFYNVPMSSLTYDCPLESLLSGTGLVEQVLSFLKIGNSYKVPMIPNGSDEFLSEISDLPFCDNTGKVPSEDAYVDLSDFEFNVVKEKVGTEIDPQIIRNFAYSNIACGNYSGELIEEMIIDRPQLTVNSEEFKERLNYCKENLDFKLEYEVDGETEVITPKQLDAMVTYTEDGPKYKNKKIDKFVTDLAGKCNEFNETYQFKTHGGSTINVKAVTFGKILDNDGTAKVIKKALKAQESDTIELKWAQVKYNGGDGIGNSYIETSISGQHVWCYKNGQCIVDCDCVTGIPGHDTSRGVFVVQYVTGPTTLRGYNGDGTKYASPVNCFIPFYNGQGFHGSNGWRSEWGGSIYLTAGSHGCVNCPDAAAKKIANAVSSGYPVVIY